MIIKAFPLSAYIVTRKPNQLSSLDKRLINKGYMKRKNYKPLPHSLTIKKSNIEGLGLFATKNIKKNINLGLTHYILVNPLNPTQDQIIRTPLGGFINHSETPNCTRFDTTEHSCLICDKWSLKTLKAIKKGEELTLKYKMYKV